MHLRFWVVAAAAMAAGAARADARRVLLITVGDQDRELAARVEGHVADLDIAIVIAAAALPRDPAGQLALARARAAEQRAEAVVWFGVDGGDWLVWAAQGDRVLARRVAQASGVLSRSASIEAVALAVRTDLRGLAAVGQIGAEVEPGPFAPLRPWVEVGWSGVLDGGTSSGFHGVAARAGVAAGRWRAAAAFAYHPAATVKTSLATMRVQRQSAGVIAGVDVLGQPGTASGWRLGLEVGAEAARFPRDTTAAESGFTPTASESPWSPVIAPSIRVARRLTPAFWLAFSVGADFLLRPPEFVVATDAGLQRVSALRTAEPRASLAFAWDAF